MDTNLINTRAGEGLAAGGPFVFLALADRSSDPRLPFYEGEAARTEPRPWQSSELLPLLQAAGARYLHVRADPAGLLDDGGAWWTLVCSPEVWPTLAPVTDLPPVGTAAGAQAGYPRDLRTWVDLALAVGPLRSAGRTARRIELTAADSEPKHRGVVEAAKRVIAAGERVQGGQAADGAALSPFIQKVVEAVCSTPPRFTSRHGATGLPAR